MAKVGVPSFLLDCHTNDNIAEIEASYGIKGFAVIVRLWQKIYGEKGYYCEWKERSPLLFLANWFGGNSGVDINLINEVVKTAVKNGIFNEIMFNKYAILTSERIQKQYFDVVKRRTEIEMINEYLLVSVDNFNNNVNIIEENVYINKENVCSFSTSKVKESKVKESKVKEIKKAVETACYFPNDEKLNQTFLDFIDMRKKIRAPMTDHAIELAVKKVINMSSSSGIMDNDIAIEILEQSIMNSWKGLFELKKSNNGNADKSDYIDKWRDV